MPLERTEWPVIDLGYVCAFTRQIDNGRPAAMRRVSADNARVLIAALFMKVLGSEHCARTWSILSN
jgi:hypothetical protein